MKSQTYDKPRIQSSLLKNRGPLLHAAVQKTPDEEPGAHASAGTRFSHSFSQVAAVFPRAQADGQPTSTTFCPLSPQRCPFGGACHTCPPRVQAKLKIGKAGDKYEQEADRVADQVMADTPQLKEEPLALRLRRQAGHGQTGAQRLPEGVAQVLKGSGKPLEPNLGREMAQYFGYDFSRVRVHCGPAAQKSARDLGAKAYTVGSNVVFGRGQFAPHTKEGRRLVAHELTHVVQSEPQGATHRGHMIAGMGASSGDHTIRREETGSDGAATTGGAGTGAAEITLETGNIGAGFLNNLVHQQICVSGYTSREEDKRCFSFAAVGSQLPQFSSTWLGWNSYVVGAILKGEVYEPNPVPGATVVNTHSPTPAQATNWLNYMVRTRLGLQDGYSVGRHNCRLFSQWEFRDAPSNW